MNLVELNQELNDRVGDNKTRYFAFAEEYRPVLMDFMADIADRSKGRLKTSHHDISTISGETHYVTKGLFSPKKVASGYFTSTWNFASDPCVMPSITLHPYARKLESEHGFNLGIRDLEEEFGKRFPTTFRDIKVKPKVTVF